MITEIIQKWEENKLKLEEYFKTTKQEEYQSHEAIVRKIFEICIKITIRYIYTIYLQYYVKRTVCNVQ